MQIVILIDGPDAAADAAHAAGTVIVVERLASAAMAARVRALTPVPDALIVTPLAGAAAPGLHAALRGFGGFSVEVQPDNISAQGHAPAGADAELYGLGAAGYALALRLIAGRAA